jgi:hypothetical protein
VSEQPVLAFAAGQDDVDPLGEGAEAALRAPSIEPDAVVSVAHVRRECLEARLVSPAGDREVVRISDRVGAGVREPDLAGVGTGGDDQVVGLARVSLEEG